MARKKKRSSSVRRDRREVARISDRWILIIRLLAGSVLGYFTFLKLVGANFGAVNVSVPADILLRIAVIVIFWSFYRGTILDIRFLRDDYEKSPRRAFGWPAITLALLMAGTIVLLARVSRLDHVVLTLSAFWVVNGVGWWFMRREVLRESEEESLRIYLEEEDYEAAFRLQLTRRYHGGHWHVWRFALGAVALLGLNAMAHTDSVSAMSSAAWDEFRGTMVLLFVLLAIGSMWIARGTLLLKQAALGGACADYRRFREQHSKPGASDLEPRDSST